jgi:hypothetical protein
MPACRTILVSLLLVFTSACATQLPMRGHDEVRLHQAADAAILEQRTATKEASVERYDRFSLAVIEFTDRGASAETEQVKQAEALVRSTLSTSRDALFVLFVHGWGHSAGAADQNLMDFRSVLQSLPEIDGMRGRAIVGIYVGWRGMSVKPPLHWLSFADRSSAADRIGKASEARDAISRLTRAIAEAQTPGRNVTAVAVGHSLGGKLLFSAIENDLRNAKDDAPIEPGSLPIFGAVAILVNPAQDVHDYEIFEDYAREHANAPLRLLIVSSEADMVVGRAFRYGRTFKNVWNYKKWRNFNGERIGLGWRDSQITHVLCSTDTDGRAPSALCDGSQLGEKVVEDKDTALYVRKGVDAAGPFRLVRADGRLIRNHGDFFNPRFATFLRTVISNAARNATPREALSIGSQ